MPSHSDKHRDVSLSIPARFISFEGIDGCGKSTLMEHLCRWLEDAGISCLRTREPGGTPIGEKIRQLLLDPSSAEMSPRAEVLLYSASRAQLVGEVIGPALKKGTWVLTDRFVDATFAYQGFGRGFDLGGLRSIQEWTLGGLWPDRTILLDCGIGTALERMDTRNGEKDRIERENFEFHGKVRDGYLALAEAEPDRFLVLNAERPLEQVIEEFHTRFWVPEMGRRD
jgi:dTMP kinase